MRAVEISAVVLFFVLLVFSASKLSFQYLPLSLIAGWLLADLFSGLVHWALDTYGSVRTPVVGPAIIRPFREHHADPQGMTRHDFFEVNGASCLGCLPLLVLSFFTDGFWHALLVSTCVGILFTNQCHKWAHVPSEKNAFPIRQLQKLGLLLKPSEHAKHHTPPYNSHFCTANGWLNGPLNRLLK
jgi:hypothetical protein